MSLLNRGTETVSVFPEETVTDADGNTKTRASSVGVVARAVVQPAGAGKEGEDVGFESRSRYRLRLVDYLIPLGAQSQVEWRGERWAVDGPPMVYGTSSRTRHTDYHIVRF